MMRNGGGAWCCAKGEEGRVWGGRGLRGHIGLGPPIVTSGECECWSQEREEK
jgi:hypothetical protein